MSSQSSVGDSDKENSTPKSNRTLEEIRSKKRVLFSPLPALLQPSADSVPGGLKIPRKSVLKPPTLSPTSSPISERENPAASNLLYMIESAIQSLSGLDRASKLETYGTLSNLFKAFENVPDRALLFPRLTELFGLILADVSRSDEEDPQKPDVPLNTKALKLAGFLLFDSEISSAVPAKMAKSLIEHSLLRMEAENVTKATSTQFLWLWQTQHLPKTIITSDIAERILLATMNARFPSIIINQEKMAVLLRLLEQARDCMVKNVDHWLPRVITYMLDDNKAIRAAALRTALTAGRHLSRVPSVGRCVQNFLKMDVEGAPFIDVTSDRFKSIIQEPEGGVYVAHAWGSVCTLSSSQNPEKSKTLMAWMHVLQIVFNSPATENKVMAQSAWVRMIHYFGNNGDIIYREKNLAYLVKPMSRMLSKYVKVYDTVRMAAVNTVCALIYVLIRPGATHDQLSLVWTALIEPILLEMLESHQKAAIRQRAIDILTALIEVKGLDPWTLDRLLDGKLLNEKELFHLDARWLRNNASVVIKVLTAALQSSATDESKSRLWTALQNSIKVASAKEIQISAEAMEATAALCTVIRNLWTAPPAAVGSPSNRTEEDPSSRTQLITSLILSTFEQVGTSTFTEKSLSISEDAIVPSQSPSKSSSQDGSDASGSGLKFIFSLFQHPHPSIPCGVEYMDCLEKIMTKAVLSQKSLRRCLALLTQCLACIAKEKKEIPIKSWKILASIARRHIDAETTKDVLQSPYAAQSSEANNSWTMVSDLLAFGAHIQTTQPYEEWLSLAHTMAAAIVKQVGRSKANLMSVEPLSACLLDANCLQEQYIRAILGMISFEEGTDIPQTRSLGKAVDASELSRTSTSELDQTCQLVSRYLLHLGNIWKRYKVSEEPIAFVACVADFIDSIPKRLAFETLVGLEAGISCWVDRSDEGSEGMICSALDLVPRCSSADSELLMKISRLISRCFKCKDDNVLDRMISTWNTSFGQQSRIEYPPAVLEAIQSLELEPAQLLLPTWPAQDPEVVEQSKKPRGSESRRQAPPRMSDLVRSAGSSASRERRSSRAESVGRSTSTSRRIKREDTKLESKKETRKRKRQESNAEAESLMPNDATASTTSELATSQNETMEPSKSTPKSKRQRRSQVSDQGSPTQISDEVEHSALELQGDEPETTTETVFTLRKRELRNSSPELHSDPISESSPSVYSRIRKRSSSQEHSVAAILQESSQPLQVVEDALVIHDDPEVQAEDALVIHDDTEVQAEDALVIHDDSEVQAEEGISIAIDQETTNLADSDDLMQRQIQDHAADSRKVEDTELIDEDLFILQLQQYRSSLNQGRPITPRRRARLGLLMKEITKLSGEITAAYFDDDEASVGLGYE